MSKTNYVHKFCYFSRENNKAVGYSLEDNLFFELNDGGPRTLTIKNDSQKFRETYCHSCDIFHSKEELKEEVQKRNIIPTLFNIIEVQKDLGWCLSYDEDVNLCPKGYTYEKHRDFQVELRPYIWVWNSTVKGNKAIKLYTGVLVDSILKGKPYHIPNVYPEGDACWGKQNPVPNDTRGAEAFFWNSSFNDSITTIKGSLQETFEEMNQKCYYNNDPTVQYNVISSPNAHGAFFSNNPKFTERFAPEFIDDGWVHGWIYELPSNSNLNILNVKGHYFLKEGQVKAVSSITYLGAKEDFSFLA